MRRIRTSALGESTRVTIDLDDIAEYASARIRNPDRIFFDIHAARLTPEMARQDIHVEGGLLTAVRMAQNQSGIVRVVLDVNGVKDYTATLLNSPAQLVIDLYPDSRAAVVRNGSGRSSISCVESSSVDRRLRRASLATRRAMPTSQVRTKGAAGGTFE